jgi:exosortase K
MRYPRHGETGNRLARAVRIVFVAAVALCLKHHYSASSPEGLRWILSPTRFVVAAVCGTGFHWESGEGYVSANRMTVIAKGCAGVNFMILAFVLLALCPGRSSGWTVLALPGAYLATVGVNAVRIVAAIDLYSLDIYGAWLTPDRMHRLLGIAVYYLALWSLHAWVNSGSSRESGPNPMLAGTAFFPFVLYVLLLVVVPLARGRLAGTPAEVTEHVACVVGFPALIIASLWGCRACAVRVFARRARRRDERGATWRSAASR